MKKLYLTEKSELITPLSKITPPPPPPNLSKHDLTLQTFYYNHVHGHIDYINFRMPNRRRWQHNT